MTDPSPILAGKRPDALVVFVSGLDFLPSGPVYTNFEDSSLVAVRDQFAARYPDVSVLCLSWNEPLIIGPFAEGRKTICIGHSFGGQRVLHSIEAAPELAISLDVILIDPVRYTASDATDPATEIDSSAVAQEFDRNPLPVPLEIDSCTAFLRQGGQDVFVYPRSSPIEEADRTRVNFYVGGVDHSSIVTAPVVLDRVLVALCERIGGSVSETFSLNITLQDIVNLKKIERGDVLIIRADSRSEIKSAQEVANFFSDRFGCFTVIQGRDQGPIEKMKREELIKLCRAMDILPKVA